MNNKYKISLFLANVSNTLGITSGYRNISCKNSNSGIPIITYHRVGNNKYPWRMEPISLDNFLNELSYLKKHYQIIPLQTVIDCLVKRLLLPQKAAVVTFDGFYQELYVNVYPILKDLHIPATIFLVTGPIDSHELFWEDKIRYQIWYCPGKTMEIQGFGSFLVDTIKNKNDTIDKVFDKLIALPMVEKEHFIQEIGRICAVTIDPVINEDTILTWDEIRTMSKNGIDFGAHTVNHPILSKLPTQQATWEIVESKKRIETELQTKVTSFAYPNGNPNDYNQGIIEIIKNSGLACALVNYPSRPITSSANLYKLDRVNAEANPALFKFSLAIMPDLINIRRRFSGKK